MNLSRIALAAAALFAATPLAAADEPKLPTWADQMEALKPVADRLMKLWGRGQTEAERQDMYRYVLGALSEGYLAHVNQDPARPTWSPIWNYAYNYAGPNPDYVYMHAPIDPKGRYRISGWRGTSRFVEVTQQAVEWIGPLKDAKPSPATHDLDALHIGKDGYFSVILSPERPAGYTGDWWRLDPKTLMLVMRKASYDWKNEVDARVAIDRLDDAPLLTTAQQAQRFSNLSAWIEGIIGFDIQLAQYYRQHHGTNRLEQSKVTVSTGSLPNQVYYDGTYQFAADEALIVETAIPAKCRYWQTLVGDDRFGTVDWVNRQSSLNGFQARVDRDGKFRAVLAHRDPGVPNWLDTADNGWGMFQLRWNRCDSNPQPVVTKVKLADVRKHLPADTPVVTPAQRKEQLRARREAAQLRQIW